MLVRIRVLVTRSMMWRSVAQRGAAWRSVAQRGAAWHTGRVAGLVGAGQYKALRLQWDRRGESSSLRCEQEPSSLCHS